MALTCYHKNNSLLLISEEVWGEGSYMDTIWTSQHRMTQFFPPCGPNKFELFGMTDTSDHDLPPYRIPKCISWCCLSVFTFLSNHILTPTGDISTQFPKQYALHDFLVFAHAFQHFSTPNLLRFPSSNSKKPQCLP